jgi:hypothetical protein
MSARVASSVVTMVLLLGSGTPASANSPEACYASPAADKGLQSGSQSRAIKGPSTALCWDGSAVTCSGAEFRGKDSDCAAGERGFCYGTNTGYLYCPVCPDPDPEPVLCSAYCPGFGPISCWSTFDCWAVDSCFVRCDNVVGGICPFGALDPPPVCPHPFSR